MTIHQAHRGQGADFGAVGLMKSRDAQIFVFPKSLKTFTGKRIVGIDYALLAAGTSVTGSAKSMHAPKAEKKARTIAPEPTAARKTPEQAVKESIPPTLEEILRRLVAVDRLLGQRKPAPARARVVELIRGIRSAGNRRNDWGVNGSMNPHRALMIVDVQQGFSPPPAFIRSSRVIRGISRAGFSRATLIRPAR